MNLKIFFALLKNPKLIKEGRKHVKIEREDVVSRAKEDAVQRLEDTLKVCIILFMDGLF